MTQHSTYMGCRTIRQANGSCTAMPFARCVCGWEGPSRSLRSHAATDGFSHLAANIAPRPGDTRACPDCGRPQHYTGTEMGWCHDATIDMMACGASPALLAELEK